MPSATDPPLLSIVIPSFNRAGQLLGLLGRLDAPDLLPFAYEVIVVDNASPDPAYERVKAFQPAHYRYAYHRRPANVGAERNLIYGLRLARGAFSVNLSDDDWFVIPELANMVAAMQADPTLVASFAAWNSTDPGTGRIVEQPSFEDLTIDRGGAGQFVQRLPFWSLWIPEHGVYRTDALARALFSMSVSYYNFTTIRRLLSFGRVRFSSRAFYLLSADPPAETGNEARQSSSYGFGGWSALARSYGIFAHWASGERLFEIPGGDVQRPFLMFHRNALYEAQQQGRFAEAVGILDYLESVTQANLVTAEYKTTLRFLGAIDEVRLAAEHLPGVSALRLVGLDPVARDLVANAVRQQSPQIAVHVQASPLQRQPDICAYLTATDMARDQIIQLHGVPPGFVFSLESLKPAFGF